MGSISVQFKGEDFLFYQRFAHKAVKERYLPSSAQLIVVNPTDYALRVTDNQQLMPTHVVSIYWGVVNKLTILHINDPLQPQTGSDWILKAIIIIIIFFL